MQIHRDIYNLPGFTNAVITIGTFDGVHLGHRQITDSLKAAAAKAGNRCSMARLSVSQSV